MLIPDTDLSVTSTMKAQKICVYAKTVCREKMRYVRCHKSINKDVKEKIPKKYGREERK